MARQVRLSRSAMWYTLEMEVQVLLSTGITSIPGREANALTGSAMLLLPFASTATFAPVAPAAKPEHSTGPADHPLFPAAEIGIDIQRKLTDDHDVHVFHVLILLFPCFQHVILA